MTGNSNAAVPLLRDPDAFDDCGDSSDARDEKRADRAAKVERYYVLTVFSLFAFAQGVLWLTFSSIDHTRLQEYYVDDFDFATVALLLNWGPIIGIVSFPFSLWIMKRPDGFHEACVCGMALCVGGALVRLIPTIVGPALRKSSFALAFLHIGQILNAAGGPLCMATTSRLSSIWFPEEQRTFSTAIAIAANPVGTNLAFILGPYVTQAGGVGALLFLGLVFTLLPAILALVHLPRWPSHAKRELPAPIIVRVQGLATPDLLGSQGHRARTASLGEASDADADEGADPETDAEVDPQLDSASLASEDSYVVPPELDEQDSIKLMLSSRDFMLTVLCGGCISGIATAWQTMLQAILRDNFDERTIGWIGCFNGFAANLGNIVAGFLSQRDRIQTELVIGLGLQICALGLFVDAAKHGTFVGVFMAVLGTGLTYGLCNPLFYELSAKLIFPVNEGVSISVLVLLLNIFACALTSAAPHIGPTSITGVFITALIIVDLIMFLVVDGDAAATTPAIKPPEAPAREEDSPPTTPALLIA
ncbi:Feline leukemia virus subgroup C receptor-related protein 2 [Hondaea fermentalgiana]|uniref:Feline leukemia virus subgroup C receptor-related protein 2 n=1 Tax=Hondaea fermentalgiana TaxID=2315210 RepID=A0A2R5GBR6_9STRA|nr:Feline leukemia virus subgroup C receptor-related protein 2 [Hondaea fermentalgiana]|eukprot:GBG25561.1 Feline leukemia virus subgroup C receptor-related protein 2 [Hondaea fermentalgiana]